MVKKYARNAPRHNVGFIIPIFVFVVIIAIGLQLSNSSKFNNIIQVSSPLKEESDISPSSNLLQNNPSTETSLKSQGQIIKLKEKPILAKKEELDKNVKKGKLSDKDSLKELTLHKKKITDEQDLTIKEINKLLNKGLNVNTKYQNVFNGFSIPKDYLNERDIEIIRGINSVAGVYPDLDVEVDLDVSIPLINGDDVQLLGYTGLGVEIAIIDTGIDYTHADLGGCFGDGCKVIGGWDYVNNDAEPMDDNGHGTHVAGIATGKGSLKGVAPDSKIYSYKVLDASGTGSSSNIMAAIDRSVDPNDDADFSDHVDIISMSLGSDCAGLTPDICGPNDAKSQAVENVANLGVVVVASAGNLGPGERTIKSPGTARRAITVGSTDKNDIIASSSSRGPTSIGTLKPDVTAPGVSICSSKMSSSTATTCIDDSHIRMSGTSMAAPHVTGAAALLLQKNPTWTPDQIKYALRNTAIDLGLKSTEQGYGRIDVLAAFNLQNPPSVPILTTSGELSGIIDITGTLTQENFQSYKLEYRNEMIPSPWNLIMESTTLSVDSILYAGFDTASLSDGPYIFRISLYDSFGKVFVDMTYVEINNIIDNQAPVAEITSPPDGSIVQGISTVNAVASDNIQVIKVEFYRSTALFGVDYNEPYSAILNLSCLAGSCDLPLSVKAYDSEGNIGVSPTITIKLDSISPTVQLNGPSDGSIVQGLIWVAANSFDDGGTGVDHVDFYKDADNTSIGQDSGRDFGTFRYQFDTKTINNGLHTFYAISYDKAGNNQKSNINAATVNNDNISPLVSITNPINNGYVSGAITIDAIASDNIGVTKVEFYKDSAATPFATDTTSPYSVVTTLSNGAHTLYAKAYDSTGNIGISSIISVTADNTAPTVSITSPANGATVRVGSKVTISTSASDSGSGINNVEFYVNSVSKCIDTISPYSCAWTVPSGKGIKYQLQAKAVDKVGLSTLSSINTVTSK